MTIDWAKFIPHLIHDVRALMRKGQVNAQMLERKIGPGLDTDAAEHLRLSIEAQRDVGQLLARVGTLLEAGQPRAGLESLDLEAVILGAKLASKDALAQSGGQIVIGEIPPCKVPLQLQRVLGELIENSIRFRDPVRPLRISLESHTGDRLEISISDNGSGWNPDYAAKLFEPFQRLDAHRSGIGLGLAIARALTESAGGTILCSADTSGARFVIALPLVT
ncbi:MAG: ATP-binding protein [Acidobacteriota bacterium]